MAFRPDAPAFTVVALLLDAPLVVQSTDALPTVDDEGSELQPGQTLTVDDTGIRLYWTGTAWKAITVEQLNALQFDMLYESLALQRLLVEDEEE